MIFEGVLKRFFGGVRKEEETYPSFFAGYNQSRGPGKSQYACYAPLKNIYFGHYGKAVACCYNRMHVLGTYPQGSIKDIWFGEKAEELRTALKNYDFSHGCLTCLTPIKDGNYDGSKARQYDGQRLNSNKYPSVLEFELDNTCNLECIMCNGDFSSLIRKNREKRPAVESPYDDAFVEQLKEFIPYLEEVKFYGGEPFMIPVYYKIWDLIVAINPATRISIQTNATMLNSRIKDLLEQGNFHINISLDSVNKEIYEAIRVNAKFDLVMENVRWFIDYCKRKNTFIGISACAMQQNWMDIPNILSFCDQNQVQLYLHTVFFPAECAIRNLDYGQLDNIYTQLSGTAMTGDPQTPIVKKNRKHFDDFLKQIDDWKKENPSKLKYAKINTPDDFLNFISDRLDQPKYQEIYTEARRRAMLDKLSTLVNMLPKDMDVTHMLGEANLSNEFEFEYVFNMFHYIEAASIEDLAKNITAGAKP